MIRKCTKCDWEYGGDFFITKCRWCKGTLDIYQCTECGSIVPEHEMTALHDYRYCKHCYSTSSTRNAAVLLDKLAALRATHAELLDVHEAHYLYLVDNPPPLRPMRDMDWYKAMKHFDGCFLCHEPAEIQWLFIRPVNGGRYAASNVLPVCGKCYEQVHYLSNPLASLDARLNKGVATNSLIKLKDALRYLGYNI